VPVAVHVVDHAMEPAPMMAHVSVLLPLLLLLARDAPAAIGRTAPLTSVDVAVAAAVDPRGYRTRAEAV
jgi:hypothetical protein